MGLESVTDLTKIPTVPPDAETSPGHTRPCTPRDIETGSVLTVQTSDDDTDDDDNNNNNNSNDRSNTETNDNQYALQLQRTSTTPCAHRLLPLWRKNFIVFITAFTALPITLASTSLFPLTQEIATSLQTTPAKIQTINAIVLVLMGCSIFIWGPVSKTFGRKNAWMAAAGVFMLATIGTALSPEGDSGGRGMAVFTAMRVVSGFEGTFFHIAGQTYIADIFDPTERGTATGLFLIGTVFGPAFGPCISGIMVTYTTWRAVLWFQVAMTFVGIILSALFLPDIRRPVSSSKNAANQKDPEKAAKMAETDKDQQPQQKQRLTALGVLKLFDPTRTFKAFLFPNILITDIACGCLSFSQYTLLASPRHILNPRFNLTTPLVSGLFYIAPGLGFCLGTLIGGRYSDRTVRKWIVRRGGHLRLPQDRLLAGRISFFLVVPLAELIYGWCLQYNVGGLPLPVVFAAVQAFGLLFAFASLNTYCAEALPRRRSEIIASKYLVQYGVAAVGSAVVVPLIDDVGIGPTTTLGAGLVLIGGCLTMVTAKYGIQMQRWAERKMPNLLAEE